MLDQADKGEVSKQAPLNVPATTRTLLPSDAAPDPLSRALSAAPTITSFGIDQSDGHFFYVIKGSAGVAYTLEYSTDLKIWEFLEEGATKGSSYPISDSVDLRDVGSAFFVRLRRD